MSKGDDNHGFDITGTKLKLFEKAINLFATHGYANVSVRDIANAVGLNPASIYNHFPSKEAFLAEAWRFYREKYHQYLTPIEDILGMISVVPMSEIRDKLYPIYPPELVNVMEEIAVIALAEYRRNSGADELIADVFIETPKEYIGAVLRELVGRDIIEPLDVDNFIVVYAAFDLYAASHAGYRHKLSLEQWQSAHNFLFSLIRFK